jgi:hypothetical protein
VPAVGQALGAPGVVYEMIDPDQSRAETVLQSRVAFVAAVLGLSGGPGRLPFDAATRPT